MSILLLHCNIHVKYNIYIYKRELDFMKWKIGMFTNIWMQLLGFGSPLVTERQKEHGVPYDANTSVNMQSIQSLTLLLQMGVQGHLDTTCCEGSIIHSASTHFFFSTFNTNILGKSFLLPPLPPTFLCKPFLCSPEKKSHNQVSRLGKIQPLINNNTWQITSWHHLFNKK